MESEQTQQYLLLYRKFDLFLDNVINTYNNIANTNKALADKIAKITEQADEKNARVVRELQKIQDTERAILKFEKQYINDITRLMCLVEKAVTAYLAKIERSTTKCIEI